MSNTTYSELWSEVIDNSIVKDSWSINDSRFTNRYELNWDKLSSAKWNNKTPLRVDLTRRQAFIEIDVLVALQLNISIDELITIYRVQFPVLKVMKIVDEYDSKGSADTKYKTQKPWSKGNS